MAVGARAAGAAPAGPAGIDSLAYAFLVHLHLAAFGRHYEALPAPVWGACEAAIGPALEPLRAVAHHADRPPPPADTALVPWPVLAIGKQARLLGRDSDTEWVDGVVDRVVAGARGLLAPALTAADHPDPSLRRHDLCAVHALPGLALCGRNRSWSRRVEQAVQRHIGGAVPGVWADPPWGLFALVLSAGTRGFG